MIEKQADDLLTEYDREKKEKVAVFRDLDKYDCFDKRIADDFERLKKEREDKILKKVRELFILLKQDERKEREELVRREELDANKQFDRQKAIIRYLHGRGELGFLFEGLLRDDKNNNR